MNTTLEKRFKILFLLILHSELDDENLDFIVEQTADAIDIEFPEADGMLTALEDYVLRKLDIEETETE